MRIYLNRPNTNEFFDIAKELRADFIETGSNRQYAVFKGKPDKEHWAIALALYDDGDISIGSINPSCDNFEQGRRTIYAEDVVWMRKVVSAIENHKKVKLNKK